MIDCKQMNDYANWWHNSFSMCYLYETPWWVLTFGQVWFIYVCISKTKCDSESVINLPTFLTLNSLLCLTPWKTKIVEPTMQKFCIAQHVNVYEICRLQVSSDTDVKIPSAIFATSLSIRLIWLLDLDCKYRVLSGYMAAKKVYKTWLLGIALLHSLNDLFAKPPTKCLHNAHPSNTMDLALNSIIVYPAGNSSSII